MPFIIWQMFEQTSAPICGVCHKFKTTSIKMNLNGWRIPMHIYIANLCRAYVWTFFVSVFKPNSLSIFTLFAVNFAGNKSWPLLLQNRHFSKNLYKVKNIRALLACLMGIRIPLVFMFRKHGFIKSTSSVEALLNPFSLFPQ